MRDILSCLPEPLISHILSFLSTKEAASTSVLSKRWRVLFATVSNLDFDDSVYLHPRETVPASLLEFVDRVLALQGNATLNKFSITCRDEVDYDRATSWILNVLGRGVSEIYLNLWKFELPLHSKLFVCKTLVKLKVVGHRDCRHYTCDIQDVSLSKLKTLYLDSVDIEEGEVGFAKLLSGCPMLEELVLPNIDWQYRKSSSVAITTLKRVKLSYWDMNENPKSVSFDTPNLVYLEYINTIAKIYPKLNFGSLMEAHIGLHLTRDQRANANGDEQKQMVGIATKFFMGICNVQTLYLTEAALEVLTLCNGATPVFNKLIHLTIESNMDIGWEALPGLLKNSPNLETLVFKGLDHKSNDGCGNMCCCKPLKNPSCLSSSLVKVQKVFIDEAGENDYMMDSRQIKHFLEKMSRLEQLIVYCNTSSHHVVYDQLSKNPKIVLPMCKIQVISEDLHWGVRSEFLN